MSGLTGWLASLTEEQREHVFAEMRRLGAESERHMREAQRMECNGSTLAVGAGAFDYLLKFVVNESFLNALRRGGDPAAANEAAKIAARECIAKHNGRRRGQLDWQRWDGAGDELAERLRETFTRAAI